MDMTRCRELIEEISKPPGQIFGLWRYFFQARQILALERFFTFDGVMT